MDFDRLSTLDQSIFDADFNSAIKFSFKSPHGVLNDSLLFKSLGKSFLVKNCFINEKMIINIILS